MMKKEIKISKTSPYWGWRLNYKSGRIEDIIPDNKEHAAVLRKMVNKAKNEGIIVHATYRKLKENPNVQTQR